MSSPTTARANRFNNLAWLCAALAVVLLGTETLAFEIDLSRRRRETNKKEGAVPVVEGKKDGDYFLDLFNPAEGRQELVILNTDKGFVPSKVSLRKGARYTIHVVNVNEKEKNVSFILDAFSEHHSTFYGKIKTFEIKPAQEGVFSFQCPETSFEGKFVVFTPESAATTRGLATDGEK
ncbi:MAG TPA: cupredoxin domain-containing protein [Bdellovibrionales bacterium]|nr:cupredoxin domain-containing protein [Bdellovibrionales bacterium]